MNTQSNNIAAEGKKARHKNDKSTPVLDKVSEIISSNENCVSTVCTYIVVSSKLLSKKEGLIANYLLVLTLVL